METDSFRGYLHRLENLGFIRRDEERRFILVNRFFRRWLQELPNPAAGRAAGPTPSTEGVTRTHDIELGVIKDRYQLLQQSGEGATGIVFKAHDKLLQVQIAIKLLRAEYAENDAVLERFRQEIILSRDIGHPNILRVYHLGKTESETYLTMQWVEGTTLAGAIAGQSPLPLPVALPIARKLASALEAAHGKKVLHRDIKPGNILLNEDREPFLTDFGVARILGQPGITRGGVFLGTPNYASPEQAKLLPLDERSDLYALGVVIFEMVTGRRPFVADTSKQVLEMHKNTTPPDPRELQKDIPVELSQCILRCLEKDPSLRFANASALREALETLERS